MKLQSLKMSGLTSAGEIAIDFADIPPGLIAIVGENGAGKTTLLESFPAANYLTLPTRGGLYPYVRERAEIDWTFEHDGHLVRPVINVNRASKRTTAALYVDGDEVTDGSGGVKSFKAAVAEYLPPYDLFRAAAFAAQDGGGSFAQADQKDRRALLRMALGLERWARRWRVVRDGGVHIDRAVERIRDRTIDLERHREALEAAEAAIRTAQAQADEARKAREAAEAVEVERVQALDAARQRHNEQRKAVEEWNRESSRLSVSLSLARTACDRAAAEHQAAEGMAGEVDELRACQARHEEAAAALAEVRDEHREAVTRRDRLAAERETTLATYQAKAAEVREHQRLLNEANAAADRMPDIEARVAKADAARADAERIDSQIAESPNAEGALHEIQSDIASLEAERGRLVGEIARAERDAGQLGGVPCGGQTIDGIDCGGCPLIATATTARDHLSEMRERAYAMAQKIDRQRNKAQALMSAVELNQKMRADLAAARERLAALGNVGEEMLQAERLASLRPQHLVNLERAQRELGGVLAKGKRLAADLADAQREADALGGKAQGAEHTAASHPSVADSLRGAQEAAARVDLLAKAAEEAAARVDKIKAEIDAHGPPPAKPSREAVDQAEMAYSAAKGKMNAAAATERAAGQALARHDTEARVAKEAIERAEALLAQVKPLESQRAALQALETACGASGVQALEMDAAGPGISDCVNAILREAYGGRFSVSLITQAEKADGKGTKEVCDIEVVDAEKNWVGPLQAASGGEQVVLEAALRLGLSAYLRGQRGDWRTCFLDEADGALDAERAERWPAMLRAAMTMSGAHHFLIVSHRESVWRQADTVIRLTGNGAEVCDPGEV